MGITRRAEQALHPAHPRGSERGVIGVGGVIRIFDLFDYLQQKVTYDQPNQHPLFKAELEKNFPVALYLGGKAPTPIPPLPPSDQFRHDIFINYRQQEPDKTWVRKTLLPKLGIIFLGIF